jgi:hypothetical protein
MAITFVKMHENRLCIYAKCGTAAIEINDNIMEEF